MTEEIDEQIAKLKESLEQTEAMHGSSSLQVSQALDELAKVLRERKQLLEATNVEARSRLIKQKLGLATALDDHARAESGEPEGPTYGELEAARKRKVALHRTILQYWISKPDNKSLCKRHLATIAADPALITRLARQTQEAFNLSDCI